MRNAYVYQVRTGFLNSSYKTVAKDHDDALTIAELIKLVQPSDLLQLTHQHNRPDCIALWIEYGSRILFDKIRSAVTLQQSLKFRRL